MEEKLNLQQWHKTQAVNNLNARKKTVAKTTVFSYLFPAILAFFV